MKVLQFHCLSLCVTNPDYLCYSTAYVSLEHQQERVQVEELRGTPMAVGTLEEIIDDNHAIVSTAVGPEYYVSILSFVDKDELEPGCTVLLHHKVWYETRLICGGEMSDTMKGMGLFCTPLYQFPWTFAPTCS